MSFPEYFLAWSRDPDVRRYSTSGGFTRELMRHALVSGFVDKLVFPRMNGLRPEVVCTDDPELLMNSRSNSIYQPVSSLKGIKNVPEGETCAVTLLPCHAELKRSPKAKLVIELLCNYTPKPEDLTKRLGVVGLTDEQTRTVTYRTGLWPGYTIAVPYEGSPRLHKYTWDNDPRRGYAPKACASCSRKAETGDLIVGDPWKLEKPYQPGQLGKTMVWLRKPELADLIRSANVEIQAITSADWERSTENHNRYKQERQSNG